MKPPRSYSDPEIARYVLGLDMPETVEGIQARLAHDDAAAARALKWEAYLLEIVDALPPEAPPETLLPRVRQTLGMTIEAPEAPSAAAPAGAAGEQDAPPRAGPRRPATGAASTRQRWSEWLRQPFTHASHLPARARAGAAAAVIVVLIVAGLLVSASLHDVHRTVVHEAVTTQAH